MGPVRLTESERAPDERTARLMVGEVQQSSVDPWRYATAGQVRRTHDDYGSAVGEWIAGQGDWQWFVTCTLRDPPETSPFTKAGSGEARRCLRAVLEQSRCKRYVCVFELQKRGATHLHALLAGCEAIDGMAAQEWFYERFGISRWKVFNPEGEAPKYIGKYLTKDVVEMYIGLDGPWKSKDFYVRSGTTRSWSTDMKGHRV